VPIAQSIPRAAIVCLLELLMYFSFAYSLKKALKDGVFTLYEITSSIFVYIAALFSTYIMLIGYYEAVGVLYFQLTSASILPKMVVATQIRIEALAVILVVSTPVLALLSTFFRVGPILKAKFSKPNARPGTGTTSGAGATTSPASNSTANGGTSRPATPATPPATLPATVNTGSVHGNINARGAGTNATPPANP
jgi:hypothetical protein